MDEPKQGMSSVAKVLLGCGVVGLLVLVGGGYCAYRTFKDAMITDPIKVRELASAVLHGAELPDEFDGVHGVEIFSVRAAALHSTEGYELIVASFPAGRADGKQVVNEFSGDQANVERIGEVVLTLHDQDVTFEKFSFSESDRECWQLRAQLPPRSDDITILQFSGLAEDFSTASLEAVLAGIPPPD